MGILITEEELTMLSSCKSNVEADAVDAIEISQTWKTWSSSALMPKKLAG
jgi:hypothetical protein